MVSYFCSPNQGKEIQFVYHKIYLKFRSYFIAISVIMNFLHIQVGCILRFCMCLLACLYASRGLGINRKEEGYMYRKAEQTLGLMKEF